MMNEEYSEREQSGIKHFALQKYLEAATRIIGSSWSGFSFVDCCAGPWNSRSSDFSDTSFGIAVEVLKMSSQSLRARGKVPGFRALLIEKRPKPYKQLAAFAKSADFGDVQVEARNQDFRKYTSEIVKFVSAPPSFSFVFVDPKGWSPVKVSDLEPLLRIRPGEILIDFMSSFIVRFLNRRATNMDEILGPDYRDLRTLEHEEQEEEAVRRYCELIRIRGDFRYVCALPVMKPDQDAIHFYLNCATRNAEGVRVFKDVEQRTEKKTEVVRATLQQRKRANLDLFTPDVLYKREERYRRLSTRSKTNAENALDSLISGHESVPYDDCWAEALQYPTVYESDLRGWLKSREDYGSIRIEGRIRRDAVLKRKSNHIIVGLQH